MHLSFRERIKKLYLLFDVDPKFLTRIEFFKLIDAIASLPSIDSFKSLKFTIKKEDGEEIITYNPSEDVIINEPIATVDYVDELIAEIGGSTEVKASTNANFITVSTSESTPTKNVFTLNNTVANVQDRLGYPATGLTTDQYVQNKLMWKRIREQ